MESIATLIKQYRKKSGLTQTELGKKLYVSKQAVSKWETDKTVPDLDTIKRLSNILNIPSDEILGKITNDPRVNSEILEYMKYRAQTNKESTQIEKWRDFKFGMFIHYGLYSILEQGEWTSKYSDAIYGTRGGPIRNVPDVGGFTNKGNKLYCFIIDEKVTSFKIPLCDGKVKSIKTLSNEGIASTKEKNDYLTVDLKTPIKDGIAAVVEIEFDREVSKIYENFDSLKISAF